MLRWLYGDTQPSDVPRNDIITKTTRNQKIYVRYVAGESPSALAKEYGISEQRIYVLIRRHGVGKNQD